MVLLDGARQTGRSRLARELAKTLSIRYVTLDDATQLAAASSDAQIYLAGLGERVVIDESKKPPADFPRSSYR